VITGRVATLLTALIAATGLSLIVVAGPAAGEPECDIYTQCDDPSEGLPPTEGAVPPPCTGAWQEVYVGSQIEMGSCQLSYDFATRTLTAKTHLTAHSLWGFHGCVKAQFINSSGTVVLETPEHRWGVDSVRIVTWTETGPGGLSGVPGPIFDYVGFVHWRC
jgi:hypothetical protein